MKPSWINVELSGASGTPPCGVITCGKLVAALEGAEEDPAEVAVMMLEAGVKAVAESVPVGLMLSGAFDVETTAGVVSALVWFAAGGGTTEVGVTAGVMD